MSEPSDNAINSNIKILHAVYGVGEFIDSIDNIREDYLIYIFDENYNLIQITSPFNL